MGRFWWGSATARPRPGQSVSPPSDGVEESLECGNFVGGEIIGCDMTDLVVTVVETIARDEPARTHLDVSFAPGDASLDIFVCEVCGPSFSRAHLELLRLVRILYSRFVLLFFSFSDYFHLLRRRGHHHLLFCLI